ncbi:hypothetical protein FRC10_003050 [Ceratobasidium sp. 414]|nr:hypothetical protein FRC10_003050 [Ceratobasidium sp. 414]
MNLANTGFDIALVWHYMVEMFGDYEGVRQSVWLYTIGAGIGGSYVSQVQSGSSILVMEIAWSTTDLLQAVIVWLGLSALTDTTITIVLVWYLFVVVTIQSGLVTAACAVADLVTFLCMVLVSRFFMVPDLPILLASFGQDNNLQDVYEHSHVDSECAGRAKNPLSNS